MALGFLAALAAYGAIALKIRLGFDDTLDVFSIHAVAGIVGALGLTFFIRDTWMAEAARAAGGTWTLWQQLGVQATAVLVTIGYAALVSWLLVILVEKTIGFRMAEHKEVAGMDQSLHGEHGYGLIDLN